MRILPLPFMVAATLGLAAGCGDEPAPKAQSDAPASSAPASTSSAPPSSPGTAQSSSGGTGVTSSATPGAATQEQKKEGANPVQQQVDPKDTEQRRDFKQSGDQQGPTSADTQPKPGN
jgi:hypothetical protein